MRVDPRLLQILFLGSFLTVGVLVRDFSVQALQIVATLASALLTQAFWLRRLGLENVGPLSAIVTGFGLSILIRADSLWAHPLLAALAISSKFLLRLGGRHLFNPANLAAVIAAWMLPGTWVSPGQWGQDLVLAGWFIGLGMLVARRSMRLDIGLCFLGFWSLALLVRVLVLGQPWPVLQHQLTSGSLLLFSFFMITDPMTTPAHPRARIVFAALVAALAYAWQYTLAMPNALITALIMATPLTWWLNRRWPAPAYRWGGGAPPMPSLAMTRPARLIESAGESRHPTVAPAGPGNSAGVPDPRARLL